MERGAAIDASGGEELASWAAAHVGEAHQVWKSEFCDGHGVREVNLARASHTWGGQLLLLFILP